MRICGARFNAIKPRRRSRYRTGIQRAHPASVTLTKGCFCGYTEALPAPGGPPSGDRSSYLVAFAFFPFPFFFFQTSSIFSTSSSTSHGFVR